MNLRQLRSLCEVVDRGLKISTAADALHRSQPSITRQMQELEQELGVDIFVRNRNRLLDLTPLGRDVLALARRVVSDTESIQKLADDRARANQGEFAVATTHTQARYVLPRVVAGFMAKFPHVKLTLLQGEPTHCCELVASGQADIAICTNIEGVKGVVNIPCYKLDRCVITPPRHPLLSVKPLTLEAIARYPVITYSESFAGGSVVSRTFAEAGLKPQIVLSAVDSDVSKAYVEMGLGVAILGTPAYNPKYDTKLRCIDARHLFVASHINVAVRAQSYLRGYMLAFIGMFAPHIRKADIDSALLGTAPAGRSRLPRARPFTHGSDVSGKPMATPI